MKRLRKEEKTEDGGERPDFLSLAQKYPSFAKHVRRKSSGEATLDWKDPEAIRLLTITLMKDKHDIDLELPTDQLVPRVTNRENYIRWLQSLLSRSNHKPNSLGAEDSNVIGIDIGTGASCIYPLLGHKMASWTFIATDIDRISVKLAQENVERNALADVIQVKLVTGDTLLTEALEKDKRYSFCMCNPPFFESVDEKVDNPKTTLIATDGELVTTGGELQFIKKMIDESMILKDRILWYSSMIGRKVTFKHISKYLQEKGINNVRHTVFSQGQTSRWGVAWTHTNDGLRDLFRERQMNLAKLHIPTIDLKESTLQKGQRKFFSFMKQLEIKSSEYENSNGRFLCNLYENSRWYAHQYGESPSSMIGPGSFVPPKKVLSFDVSFIQVTLGANVHANLRRDGGELKLLTDMIIELKEHIEGPNAAMSV